jgi:hypothetical protein
MKRPGSGLFSGEMIHLAMWNIALTDQQVLGYYKSQWIMNEPRGLLLYYPFLKSTKLHVRDFSGNNLQGNRQGTGKNSVGEK